MPYGNPGPSDDAMFSDGGEPAAPVPKEKEEKEEGGAYPPFTVPRSAFGPKEPEPGQEYYFKVDSVHEDEVVLRYSTGEEEHKEGGEEGAEPEAPKGDSEMSGMMY